MPSRYSTKWDQLYFLKYDADDIIDETGDIYSGFFNHVPADQRFTNGQDGNGWTALGEGASNELKKITMADKLFILSHGESNGQIGNGSSPDVLARDLKNWGLKNVGLITFKCCNLGIGSFLEMFVSACSGKKITVGWVKGYKGIAKTLYDLGGTPYEFVRKGIIPKFGDDRVKIVQGNHPTPIEKFERYSYE